jgi:hypothetical protein
MVRLSFGGGYSPSEEQLDGAIDDKARWKKALVAELSDRLWSKVKHNEMCSPGVRLDPKEVWKAPQRRSPDFRFLNLNRCYPVSATSARAMSEDAFDFLMRQYVARFDRDAFPAEALGVFSLIRQNRDFSIGDRLLRGIKRLPVAREEPRDLFLYN